MMMTTKTQTSGKYLWKLEDIEIILDVRQHALSCRKTAVSVGHRVSMLQAEIEEQRLRQIQAPLNAIAGFRKRGE